MIDYEADWGVDVIDIGDSDQFDVEGISNDVEDGGVDVIEDVWDGGWDGGDISDIEDVCIPDCNGKECGPDGCGGVCGGCGIWTIIDFFLIAFGSIGDAAGIPLYGRKGNEWIAYILVVLFIVSFLISFALGFCSSLLGAL